MRTQLVNVTNRVPDRSREPYYHYMAWVASARRFGVEPTVIGMNAPFFGLMSKPKRMREWLKSGECTADLVLWTDSFDVILLAHPDIIGERYVNAWPIKPVVYNCEKGLWPRTDLADRFPDGGTPWRHLNSGLIIGTPQDILRVLEWMPLDDIPGDCVDPMTGRKCEPNDQAWHQLAWSARPVGMALDYRCEVFQALSGCTEQEYEFVDGNRFRNTVTGTFPLVLHANGGAKDALLPGILATLGIQE